MKILIIGATRGIGMRLLEQALDKGHTVTALVRKTERLKKIDEKIKMIKGDILDRVSVDVAMEGQDAICCCIGIGPTRKPVTVFSDGMKNVLSSMKVHGIRKLITVTGVGAGDSRNHGGFLYDKIFNPFFLKTIYEDKDREESLIKASEVDWVIVRPGFLTNGLVTGEYRLITDMTGVKAGKISRADVAHFILEQLVNPTYLRKTPLLTY